jgi:hypothetical protein
MRVFLPNYAPCPFPPSIAAQESTNVFEKMSRTRVKTLQPFPPLQRKWENGAPPAYIKVW